MRKSFGSDNFSAALPEVLRAIAEAASSGHEHPYGGDPFTAKAEDDFRKIFGHGIEVLFVYGGTGANVLGISAFAEPYNAVICAETSHIYTDECGAVEKHAGCRLVPLQAADGKLSADSVRECVRGYGSRHRVCPSVVSISQCTELGTAYTVDEIGAIAAAAHSCGMYLHVDGARIANAVAYLGCDPAEIRAAGVDVLSFGGTKNGMLFGEAVIFFTHPRKDVRRLQKQLMQLHSKGRFIAAQFSAALSGGLWLRAAAQANGMARLLAEKAAEKGIKITRPVQGNEVFATVAPEMAARLSEKSFFHVWNSEKSEVRWICSFDTTEKDVNDFVNEIG